MMAWLRGLYVSAKTRLAARPDTEHEQAIVRLAVGLLLGAYFLPGGLRVSEWSALEFHYIAFACYVVIAVLVLAWIFASESTSHVRS
jgi:hypothetical protein